MASNPPGECCTMGHLHSGTAKGKIQQFAGVETYIVHPASGPSKKIIFYLTDVLGHRTPNPQLLADGFAKAGYSVIMPDILHGDPVLPEAQRPAGFSLQDWLKNHQAADVQKIVDAVYAEIKTQFNPEAIGAVGYCFGAKFVVRLMDGRIGAGYVAHPSFVTLEEVAAIKAPLCISAAQTDAIFTTELRHQTEEKLNEIGATYQITLYSKTEHGFAVRGDLNNKHINWAKEQAFKQALEWFSLYL